jgi:hypothetical protein
MPTVTDLLSRAESFHREIALESFNFGTGRKDSLDIVSIIQRYPELGTKETLDFVRSLDAAALPEERDRILLEYIFTGKYIFEQLKHEVQELENAEAAAKVSLDGQEYTYHSMPVVTGNEQDYAKRGRLDAAYIEALAALNPQREAIDAKDRALVEELGWKGTIELCEKLGRLRIYPLRDLTRQFLTDTHELYEEKLTQFAAKSGLQRHELRHGDIGYMHRLKRFDALFPKAEALPALARTLKGLGIDLEEQQRSNVTLDMESRPTKNPRAFCIGVDVPRDVRLSVMPRGGQDDYAALFHESGHLEFGAHMAPELSFLYRQYGDTSVHESYAFLFEHLIADDVWWREVMGREPVLDNGESFTEFSRFHLLYMVRRYSAKLQYEVDYHEAGGGPALAQRYAYWLEQGTGIPYPAPRYLADFDGGFYVVQYLQAWLWEVQLRAHLRERFGEAWFTNPRAGDALRELWRQGQRYDVWEIAQQLGYGGVEIEPLKRYITNSAK